jgi:hypothetical protein
MEEIIYIFYACSRRRAALESLFLLREFSVQYFIAFS